MRMRVGAASHPRWPLCAGEPLHGVVLADPQQGSVTRRAHRPYPHRRTHRRSVSPVGRHRASRREVGDIWGPATHWLTGAPPIDRSPEEMFHTPGTHTRSLTLTIVVLVGVATFMPAHAQADDFARWRLDGGLTFSHFEQQIKTEIGGARGDRLVTDSEFGLNLFATFNPIPY